MKRQNPNNCIQITDSHTTVRNVIEDIVNSGSQEEPFYICNLDDVVYKYENWRRLVPRVEPYYAIKCNTTPEVLEVLAALGAGFDCASKGEINQIVSLGVNPNRIIFANPTKPASHIQFAANVGVHTMTFDGEIELYKIKNLHPTAKMVLRIKFDDPQATFPLGSKFGCDAVLEAPQLLKLARDLDVDVVGVSFHVGSSSHDPTVFRGAIKAASGVFEVAARLGFDFKLLDIGGGYPGAFGTSIANTAHIINLALHDFFPDPSIRVISEPGRYFVNSAFTLASSIHSIKIQRKTSNPNRHFAYYMNAGVYGAFLANIFNANDDCQPEPVRKLASTMKTYTSTIWGPTCDSTDKIYDNIVLPELELGDWVIFRNLGAYTTCIASEFNGFPIPKIHAIANLNTWSLIHDSPPFCENSFVFGNSLNNLRMGLDNENTISI